MITVNSIYLRELLKITIKIIILKLIIKFNTILKNRIRIYFKINLI